MYICPLLIIFIVTLAQENTLPTTKLIPLANNPHELNGDLVQESTGSVGSKVCSYNTSEGIKYLRITRDKECQKNWAFSR